MYMEPIQLPIGNPVFRKLQSRNSSKVSFKSHYSSSNEENSEEEVDGKPAIIQIPIGRPKRSDEVIEARFTRDMPDVTPRISTGLNHITLIPVGNGVTKKKSERNGVIRVNSRPLTSDNYSIGTQTRNGHHYDSFNNFSSDKKKSRKSKDKSYHTVKEPLKDEQTSEKRMHGKTSPTKKHNSKQQLMNYHSDNDDDSMLDISDYKDFVKKRSRIADIYKKFFTSREDSTTEALDSKINKFERSLGSNFSSTDLNLRRESQNLLNKRSSSPFDTKELSWNRRFEDNSFLGVDGSYKEPDRRTAVGDQWPSYKEMLNISTPKVNKYCGLNRPTYNDDVGLKYDQSIPNIEGQNGSKVQPSVHFWMTNLPDGSSMATIQAKSATNAPRQFDDISNLASNSTYNQDYQTSKLFNNNAPQYSRDPSINHQLIPIEPNGVSHLTPNFNSNFSNMLQSYNQPFIHPHNLELSANPQRNNCGMTNFHSQLQPNGYQNPYHQTYIPDQRDYATKPFLQSDRWNQQCINTVPQICHHLQNNLHTRSDIPYQLCNFPVRHIQTLDNSNVQANQSIQSLHPHASNLNCFKERHFQNMSSHASPSTYILSETSRGGQENYLSVVNLPNNTPNPVHFVLTPAHMIAPNDENVIVRKVELYEKRGQLHRDDVPRKDGNSTARESSGAPVLADNHDITPSSENANKSQTFEPSQSLPASQTISNDKRPPT